MLRLFGLAAIVALCAGVFAGSKDAQATHVDGMGTPLPHATVTVWNVQPLLGDNPDDSVEDLGGLTVDVATAAAPLTIATAWENTTCPGGPCGAMLWNPVTNDFNCWGVTGGFTASIDLNVSAPTLTGADLKVYQPGDIWVGGPNSAPIYVKFKGAASLRIWFPSGSVWDVLVDQGTGEVWFSSPFDGSINRLDPSTDTHTKWVVGGQPRELAQDSAGLIYATAGTAGIVRLNPVTDDVRKWAVAGLFTGTFIFATPDGIDIDSNGNVWFTESVSSEIGRLNPTTDVISEFTKAGLSNPQLIATTGSGGNLQAFFTEGAGSAISIVTEFEAAGTDTAVTPVDSIVTPTTPAIGRSDRALSFRRVTIRPTSKVVDGLDGGPDASGTTFTAGPDGIPGNADDERIPGLLRFPVAAVAPSLTFTSGMTGVALPNTVFGAALFNSKVFQLTTAAIVAPVPTDEIEVMIDVKAFSDPNGFNCKKKGVLPVTIWGKDNFDVSEIDLTTVQLKLTDGTDVGGPVVNSLICDRGDPDIDKGSAGGTLVADCFDAAGLPGQDGVPDKEGGTLDGFDDIDVRFDAQTVIGQICTGARKRDIIPIGGLEIMGLLNDGTPFFSTAVPDVGIDQLLAQQVPRP